MAYKRKKKRRFSWFRLCLVIITCYFGYVFFCQQSELYKIRRETNSVNAKLSEAADVSKGLATEKENLSTAAYIEKLAREQLGLVKPGEVPYIPAKQ